MSDWNSLNALADGHLEGEERSEMLTRLEQDPALRGAYANAVLAKDMVRTHIAPVMCEDTWSKCVGRLDEIDRTKPVELFIHKYSWAMAACLMLVIFGAGISNRLSPKSLSSTEVPRMAASLSSVAPSGTGVLSWLSNRLGLNVRSHQVQQGGVAEGEFDGRRVTRVGIFTNVGPMQLIAVSNTDTVDGDWTNQVGQYRVTNIGDQNCVVWTKDNYALCLIGRQSPEQLVSAANQIQIR